MESTVIVALVIAVIFIGAIAWMAIASRREKH